MLMIKTYFVINAIIIDILAWLISTVYAVYASFSLWCALIRMIFSYLMKSHKPNYNIPLCYLSLVVYGGRVGISAPIHRARQELVLITC